MSGKSFTKSWTYHNDRDERIGLVKRFETDNGKEVIPYFEPDGSGAFLPGIPDSLKGAMPLYGQKLSEQVFIVEGEKCVDCLLQMGLSAFTSQGGARAASKSDWSKLANAERVIFIPDQDEAGVSYATEVAQLIRESAHGASLEVLVLPELGKGGDVADWAQAQLPGWDGFYENNGLKDLAEALIDPEAGGGTLIDFDSWSKSQADMPLDDLLDFLCAYVVYPCEHSSIAHVLWIAHTHLMECWEITPRLAVLSPEKACGKTRLLEVTEHLVPNPVRSGASSPAFIIRSAARQDDRPTLMLDEIDTVFEYGAKAASEIRNLINVGHARGSDIGRVTKENGVFVPERLPSYCALAMAGIDMGRMPDTVLSRSVVINMRRRLPGEQVHSWRTKRDGPKAKILKTRISSWCRHLDPAIAEALPQVPSVVEDRSADAWEPLLAIAEAAGGTWPERARAACVALVAANEEESESIRIQLLRDIKSCIGTLEGIRTEELIRKLRSIPEGPWAELGGTGIGPNRLARELRPFKIKSTNIRFGKEVFKGYQARDFVKAWASYLKDDQR